MYDAEGVIIRRVDEVPVSEIDSSGYHATGIEIKFLDTERAPSLRYLRNWSPAATTEFVTEGSASTIVASR